MTADRDRLAALVAQLPAMYGFVEARGGNSTLGPSPSPVNEAWVRLADVVVLLERLLTADRPEPIAQPATDRPDPMRRDLAVLLDNLYGLHVRPGHIEAVLDVVHLHAPVKVPVDSERLLTAEGAPAEAIHVSALEKAELLCHEIRFCSNEKELWQRIGMSQQVQETHDAIEAALAISESVRRGAGR